MGENEVLSGDMGSVWLQPDGPNSIPRRLGCYEMGDATEPRGAITRTRCPDPKRPGKWNVVSTRVGPPDFPSVSINGLLGKTADYLQKVTRNKTCPLGLYAVWAACAPRDLFANYTAVKVFENAQVTNHGQGSMVQREGNDASTQSWDFDVEKIEMVYPLSVSEPVNTEDKPILDITSCNDAECTGGCGPASDLCDKLYASTKGAVADKGDLMVSADGGVTWTISAAQPFANAEDLGAVVCFQVAAGVWRVLVTCATTAAGSPARVAYTDDDGATWTVVNVNATNATFFTWNGSLFALDMYHIWAGTDAGAVYFSEDGGVTWTLQSATPAADIHVINFLNEDLGILCGDANLIYRTEDGGEHWIAVTGPAAQAAVAVRGAVMIDRYRWHLVYQDGELWYTTDGGATWTQRTIPIPDGVTAMPRFNSIEKWDEYVIYISAHGTLAGNNYPVILRSWDGGYTWEGYVGAQLAAGIGIESVQVCGANSAIGVGNLTGAIGTIMAVIE